MPQTEKSRHYKKLGRQERPSIFRILTQAEQETCNTPQSLFNKLIVKFKPQYNETI